MYAVVEQDAKDLPLGEQLESLVLKSNGKQGYCHTLVVPQLYDKKRKFTIFIQSSLQLAEPLGI